MLPKIQTTHPKTFAALPEKILQFGEGNFLRAFADYIVETANRQGKYAGSVVIAQPIAAGLCEKINAQNGMYTVLARGRENGAVTEQTEIITSVSRCINPYEDFAALLEIAVSPALEVVISNTTEAGIAYRAGDLPSDAPPSSYPAKLAVLLYARWQAFSGAADKGLLILPVELIEANGDTLRKAVLQYAAEWGYEAAFVQWLKDCCCFANTLVDRIVTGYPGAEAAEICEKLGYADELITTCEPFLFWAIECPKSWHGKFPVDTLGLDIRFAEDITAYRTRKVRILNGAHTSSVPAAYFAGHEIVSEMVGDTLFRAYLHGLLFEEIIPLIDLPRAELDAFAAAVLERFANPFIQHRLLDISLNSVSKFKSRCLPSLNDFVATNGELPKRLCFALAALLRFYQGEWAGDTLHGNTGTHSYEIRDDLEVCKAMTFTDLDSSLSAVLSNESLWGQDLTAIPGLTDAIKDALQVIESKGIREAVQAVCNS